jgi:hypothetical protein
MKLRLLRKFIPVAKVAVLISLIAPVLWGQESSKAQKLPATQQVITT